MSQIHVINGHMVTVNDEGKIGPCDCEDYSRKMSVHKGWCKHRLVVATIVGGEIIASIDSLTKRLASARAILEKLEEQKHHPACFPDGDNTSACHPGCKFRAEEEGIHD